MIRRCLVPACALLLGAVLASTAREEAPRARPSLAHWTHWRGPSGQGYCDDKAVPLTWSEKENVLWKTALPGGGNSSPIIHGDKVFLTAASDRGRERYVLCVRATDGKLLWKQTAARDVPREETHGWNGYASPSCATDGTHVYAFFGTPGLFCYDLDGKRIWKHNFGIFTSAAGWGTAASPVLFEDLVIQNCDNDGGPKSAPEALVALDKKTGRVRWTAPRNQGRGFSTPRLMSIAGRTDLVLNGPLGVWGYDPRTGRVRWFCKRDDPRDLHRFGEPLPVDDGRRLFILSGRTGPWQIVKMPNSRDGEGDVTATHVLHTGRRKGRDVSSPIVWAGRVYIADREARLTCFDFESGKELYTKAIGKRAAKSLASPIAVRGKLLFLLDDGTTVVIEPGPELKIVGRNRLGRGKSLEFGASPAVGNGRLYLRSQSYLYCIGTKK
jgi:outer membrane protein assembly factor BamB